ncbi:MAG TPA: alanine--glyoxylate aminotransferase family protein [Anaerolineae bacterium]|nr:alanine--glyoxylate aminotransferase family protein [Anaerolineae bacterium]
MIPGPIEFDPAVLRAMAAKTGSHVSPDFAEVFGEALEKLREVFLAPRGQPFVVAGSGTLAMDMAAANLIEPGDRALVVNTGYFSDRFVDVLERYGAEVVQVKAELGDVPPPEEVEEALRRDDFKLMAVTHVDTSTGVVADVKTLASLAQRYGALSVVDGVCATAGEECRQEEWGIDVYLTASQKAIGVPPGLALLMAGPRAMEIFNQRKAPVANYYADWACWLPIMEAYEARQPLYFATPPVNLIYALRESLGQILAEGMEARFRRHRIISDAFKAAVSAWKLRQVPLDSGKAAHTMTTIYYPEGIDRSLLAAIKANGVVVAGGLHPAIKDQYFRVGHMGAVSAGDILATASAIGRALAASGYELELGAGVAAAQRVLVQL